MDCFGCFFQADELKGDNMYRCEKCKMLRNGLKYSQVNINAISENKADVI